ncbi:MAG: hypothetical protein JNM56_33025 [Planctomycetia bacterium]|nr:hypothetical protein [Planctomycetia bacterium]
MTEELWRTALATIRNRFLIGHESHPGLKVALVHGLPAPTETNEGELHPPWSRIKDKTIETMAELYTADVKGVGFQFFGEASYGPRCRAFRNHFVSVNFAGYRLLRLLGNDAAKCLRDIPDNRLTEAHQDSLIERPDLYCWLWVVFDLAWGQRFPPLAAERHCWKPGVTSHQDWLWRSHRGLDVPDGVPEYFHSELPDALLASVYAIDMLLAETPDTKTDKQKKVSSKPKPGTVRMLKQFGQALRREGKGVVQAEFAEHYAEANSLSISGDSLLRQYRRHRQKEEKSGQ